MLPWRLKWVLREISDLGNVSRHRAALRNPWKFWAALLLKFVPRVWPFPIHLHLRRGGVVAVYEFMTLFVYKEIFVDGCYDVPVALGPEPVIIDIGANTGLFILRMKQLHPDCRVTGYEPMPSNFAQLQKNLERSGLTGVDVVMRGVGSEPGTVRLYVHRGNIGGHSIFQNQTGGRRHIEIELVGVRELLERAGSCALLKLDCEGAEFQIIKALTADLAARVRHIFFEATPSLYDPRELVTHLESLGYQLTPYRGLYLAVRP